MKKAIQFVQQAWLLLRSKVANLIHLFRCIRLMQDVPVLAEISQTSLIEPESVPGPEKVYSEKPMVFGEKLIFSLIQKTELELDDKKVDREIERFNQGYTKRYGDLSNSITILKRKIELLESLLIFNIKTRLKITKNPIIFFKPGYIIAFSRQGQPCDNMPCGDCDIIRACNFDH